MMNTYEQQQLDQPLDLRLKALNLTYPRQTQLISNPVQNSHQHPLISIPASINIGSALEINGSSRSNSSSSTSICSNRSLNSIDGFISPAVSKSSHQQQQQASMIPLISTPSSTVNQHHYQLYNSLVNQHLKDGHQNHLRSINIHCQPLNHHEPHPLSRLHPPPSHLQPPAQAQLQQSMSLPPTSLPHLNNIHQSANQASQAQTQPQTQQQQHQVAPPAHPMSNMTQLVSPQSSSPQQVIPLTQPHHFQQHPSALMATTTATTIAGRQQQLSPQQQQQQQHMFTPMPIKSLSIPSHMLSSSPSFSILSSSSPTNVQSAQLNTDPNSISINSNPTQNNNTNNDCQVANDSNQISVQTKTQTGDSAASQSQITKMNTNRRNSGSNSMHSTDIGGTNSSNNADQISAKKSHPSPIVRQHSLTSNYNCSCGVPFQLRESLRAHQEGYCANRDRGQKSQMRSLSAVSPTVIQDSK